jgi:pteridine reductase
VGAAICRRLHAGGASLMLHYRASAGEARLLQAELNGVRANSVALIQADLLDLAKLPSLVDQTVMRFGRLDALVNNASSFFATPLGEIQLSHWDDLVGTNVRAPLFLSQAAAGPLRKSEGAIVNVTDIHAERPMRNYVVYSIAKAALTGLTRSLARELAPDVRVNAVAPGPILWPEDDDASTSFAPAHHLAHAAQARGRARRHRARGPLPARGRSLRDRRDDQRRRRAQHRYLTSGGAPLAPGMLPAVSAAGPSRRRQPLPR